jgi:hypothetical protein
VDSTDLTPERPPLDPAEQRVADAVRGALGAPTPRPGLLDAVQARAVRRHRRRAALGATGGALALAGLVALLPLQLATVPRPVAEPTTSPTPAPDESGSSELPAAMLTEEEIATVLPGATSTSSEGGSGSAVLAGLCGTTVLEGDPLTTSIASTWSQEPTAGAFAATVREEVTRWPSPERATAHAEATAASPTQCGGSDRAPFDQATFVPLAAQQDGGPPRTLAAAAVEGSETGWVVRATDVADDGVTVVDLTVTLEAESSAAAGSAVEGLLELALVRAVEKLAQPMMTSPPLPLDQDPLLPPDLVGFFIPSAAVVEEPARVDAPGTPVGGLCGDAVLTGVPPAAGTWAGAWEQDGPGARDGDAVVLRERVLRWDTATPEAAASYVEATRSTASAGGCGDAEYRVLPEMTQEGEVEVVAVAPAVAPSPDSGPAWRVRAVSTGLNPDQARDTVVDLDLVVLAATAEDAAWIADGVLTISLTQATTDTSRLVDAEATAP